MTHIEFFPYHNRHIRFKLNDGTELTGVLIDTIRHTNPTLPDTVYKYIPTTNMLEWKQAEEKNDTTKMKHLESQIDIKNIVHVTLIK